MSSAESAFRVESIDAAGSLLTGDGLVPGNASVTSLPAGAGVGQSVLCHYCRLLPGSTRDHVVPRMRLERGKRMLGGYTNNSVPACAHCNQRKGNSRVDCCAACSAKWAEHGPPDWEITVPVLSLIYVTSPARAVARQ